MDGIIALVGGEEFSPDFSEVHKHILSFVDTPNPKLVFFPTAASSEGLDVVNKWSNIAAENLSSLGARVDIAKVIDTESANDPKYSEMVESADVIYLGGGLPDVYFAILQNSKVWNAVESAHKQGKLIIGASAGAMILSEHTLYAEFQGDYPPSHWGKGFNLIPQTGIAPHFNTFPQAWIAKVKKNLPQNTRLLGIDEKTALIKQNNIWKVQGKASITVLSNGQEKVFTSGDEIVFDKVTK
jgi:cyanophycinase-like exopeptidase